MSPHALEALEFERIRDLLAARAASEPGRARARALAPLDEPARCRELLAAVGEVRALQMEARGWPSLGFPDIREALQQARIEGELLEAPQLRAVARFLEVCAQAGRVTVDEGVRRRYPRIAERCGRLLVGSDFPARIERTLDPAGEVRDEASGALRALRRRLRRSRQEMAARLEQMSRSLGSGAEESLVTLRGGRYVLTLATTDRRRMEGIVHDRSASGRTVYVEPLAVVEQNNEIAEIEADERAEVRRILLELTGWVRERGPAIEASLQTLAELDEWNARAALAQDLNGALPLLEEACGELRIVRGRHPLLYAAHGARVVPLDLELAGERRGLVISGPNMGGKTVVLKTVGLIVAMAQSGLYVPAADGTVVPWVEEIFIDMGDEQSLESDLSTYAARLRHMRAMLERASARSLVLIDEIGSGTDPEEGTALGEALLEEIGGRGAFCLVSTHHGAFKTFAAEGLRFQNASMDYDAETLHPTYALRVGQPGRSHAFELARREGWPEAVLAAADGRRSEDSRRADRLLSEVEALRQDLERARSELANERREVEQAREQFRRLAQSLKEKMEGVRLEKALEEDRRLRELHELLRELRARLTRIEERPPEQSVVEATLQAERAWFHAEERRVAELQRSQRPVPRRAPPQAGGRLALEALRPGARAFSRSLGVPVEILEVAPQHRQVWVSHRGMRIALAPADLREVHGGGTSAPAEGAAPAGVKAFLDAQDAAQLEVRGEIDLRGTRAEDCLQRLEAYIDRALLAGYPQVRIIHGKGEGILRREVRRFLEGRPDVRDFRDGEGPEGGWGVTIALLGDAPQGEKE